MRQQKYTQAQQVIDNQGLIIEIGNMKHYATYVPAQDPNRKFLEKPLKDNGTIWISGTYHNIFSVANCLKELGYKILNVITWQKTNPPANISCRFFTYSTEFVIWARKMQKVPHKFNYGLMKKLNDGKQMTDVWRMPAIGRYFF